MKNAVFIAAALMLLVSATNDASAKKHKGPDTKNMEVFFNSGFESGSTVIADKENLKKRYIIGIDKSVNAPNDWSLLKQNRRPLGRFALNLDQGDTTQRNATIVADPTNPDNKVLLFCIEEPHINARAKNGVAYKARVQSDLHTDGSSDELYHSVRVYLPSELEKLKEMPAKLEWFTIAEWWNNPPNRQRGYTFRISIDLYKEEGKKNIYFSAKAQNYKPFDVPNPKRIATGTFTTKWREISKLEVPFGQWMTIEYYLKKGDEASGRFYMTVQPDGGKKQVIFDIKGDTYGLGNPNPSGVVPYFSPMKLYTSAKLVNFLKEYGIPTRVYFDDLKVMLNPLK